jgi:hypothetical protein
MSANTNRTFEYGDLLVTLTSAYAWRWNDKGSGAKRNGGFWHPAPQGPQKELRALGSVCVPHYGDINNQWAVMLVGAKPGAGGDRPAVKRPTDYAIIVRWISVVFLGLRPYVLPSFPTSPHLGRENFLTYHHAVDRQGQRLQQGRILLATHRARGLRGPRRHRVARLRQARSRPDVVPPGRSAE